MKIKHRDNTPQEQAALENAQAQAEINKANIDYIAMMTDVEIPTEEMEGMNDESEI